jgi:hypothetical protein
MKILGFLGAFSGPVKGLEIVGKNLSFRSRQEAAQVR